MGDAAYGLYRSDDEGRLIGAEYADGYVWSHE